MMAVKKLAKFKRIAILSVALLGLVVIVNRTAPGSAMNQAPPVWKSPISYRLIVAQNESQTATNDKRAPSPESTEPESKTEEKKDSTGVKAKPLKDFQPSERIEAEQAVDFPYDI